MWSLEKHIHSGNQDSLSVLNGPRCALERQEVGVKWFKNGNELEHGDKYRINTDGRWHYLEIRNIAIEDEGTYLAKISGSSFESMAQLLVEGAKVNSEHFVSMGHFSFTPPKNHHAPRNHHISPENTIMR